MGYEYERVSDIHIADSLHDDLKDQLMSPCYNLSTILTDYNGKISPSTAQLICNKLTIVAPGLVMLGSPDGSEDIKDTNLGVETYANEVSPSAYTLYTKYLTNDVEAVLLETGASTLISPLLELSSGQPLAVISAINALYVDVMALYQELLKTTPETNLVIPRQDLFKMDGNIRWITAKIEQGDTRPYELIEVLRDLQRNLMIIRSMSQVFYSTYYSRMDSIDLVEEV